jgi:hypothetical protein
MRKNNRRRSPKEISDQLVNAYKQNLKILRETPGVTSQEI